MAALEVGAFTISDQDVQEIANDPTEITIQIAWDAGAPGGWEIVAAGPLGTKKVCPKPCPKIVS